MAWKSLLTFSLAPDGHDAVAIDAAARIARDQDAHLEAIALGVDYSQLGYAFGGGAMLLQASLERAGSEAEACSASLRQALERHGPELRWSQDSAVSQLGSMSELVATRARFADLVVLAAPYGDGRTSADEAVIEAAMFDGMAPVLVVPAKGMARPDPRRIVLAWNQSREALVAARRALPFLKRAEQVVITVVDPPAQGPEQADPGQRLCQMLVRHGVKAEVAILARQSPRIADVLARQCRDIDAEMLVMGAYGHSRFREAIMGGATRDTLEAVELPVFLAH